MEIRYIANGGIYLRFGESSVLIDALHRGNTDGFAQVSEQLWERMKEELPQPELILFSHCHPDHFSGQLLAEARAQWPDAEVAIPLQFGYEHTLISGEKGIINLRSGSVEYFRLTHEGEEYKNVPHYGFLIKGEGLKVFISGDCAINAPELSDYYELENADAAVMNFPWLTLRAGRRFIDEVLRPEKLFICHIPPEAVNGLDYMSAAENAAQRYYSDREVCLLTESLKKFTV